MSTTLSKLHKIERRNKRLARGSSSMTNRRPASGRSAVHKPGCRLRTIDAELRGQTRSGTYTKSLTVDYGQPIRTESHFGYRNDSITGSLSLVDSDALESHLDSSIAMDSLWNVVEPFSGVESPLAEPSLVPQENIAPTIDQEEVTTGVPDTSIAVQPPGATGAETPLSGDHQGEANVGGDGNPPSVAGEPFVPPSAVTDTPASPETDTSSPVEAPETDESAVVVPADPPESAPAQRNPEEKLSDGAFKGGDNKPTLLTEEPVRAPTGLPPKEDFMEDVKQILDQAVEEQTQEPPEPRLQRPEQPPPQEEAAAQETQGTPGYSGASGGTNPH